MRASQTLRPPRAAGDQASHEAEVRRDDVAGRRLFLWRGAPVILTAATAGLVFARLGSKSLWVDEGYSVGVAGLPLSGIWEAVTTSEPNMSLYYVLLHFWISISDGEFWVRALSAISAVGVIPALFLAGRRSVGRPAALLAGAFLAVNVFFIGYGQEARSYALGMLLLTISWGLFLRVVEEHPSTRRLALWSVVSALATYAHVLSLLVIAAQPLSLLFLPRDRRRTRHVASGLGLLLLLAAPLLALVVSRGGAPLHWVPPLSWGSVVQFWEALVGYTGPVGMVGVLALAGWAVVDAVRVARTEGPSVITWRRMVPVCWFFVPALLMLAASPFQPLFLSRYAALAVPGLALTLGSAVMRLPRFPVRALVGAVLILLTASRLPSFYAHSVNDDWRGTVRYVLEESRPGDGLFFQGPHGVWVYRYYARQFAGGQAGPEVVYPTTVEPGDFAPDSFGSFEVAAERAAGRYDRLWIIFNQSDYAWDLELIDILGSRHRLVEEVDAFSVIAVQLYEAS